jgi:hypothetical protein
VEEQRAEAFIRYSHPSVWFMDVDVVTVDRGTFEMMFAQSSDREVESRTAGEELIEVCEHYGPTGVLEKVESYL